MQILSGVEMIDCDAVTGRSARVVASQVQAAEPPELDSLLWTPPVHRAPGLGGAAVG